MAETTYCHYAEDADDDEFIQRCRLAEAAHSGRWYERRLSVVLLSTSRVSVGDSNKNIFWQGLR